MAYNTVLQQGSFVSTGATQTIQVRSGVDWIRTYNYTQIAANAVSTGYEFYWQFGMPQGGGLEWQSNGGGTAVNIIAIAANAGFTIVDSSAGTLGAAVAITAGTNAVRPVYSTGSTAGLSVGSVVRLTNLTGQPNLAGYDFSIDTIVANTSFRIANALANAPGAAATAGFYRIVPFDPIYYPTRRNIVNITQAAQAVVTTSVNHAYVPGMSVRLYVPSQFGMIEANGLLVNITAVTAGTFTVNLDTTAFTAFVFPGAAAVPFTPAEAVPVGEETDQFSNPNLLDDATVNTAYIGVQLAAGVNSPAGQAADVIYWLAGKSFNI
jgi:hypothetical protein